MWASPLKKKAEEESLNDDADKNVHQQSSEVLVPYSWTQQILNDETSTTVEICSPIDRKGSIGAPLLKHVSLRNHLDDLNDPNKASIHSIKSEYRTEVQEEVSCV